MPQQQCTRHLSEGKNKTAELIIHWSVLGFQFAPIHCCLLCFSILEMVWRFTKKVAFVHTKKGCNRGSSGVHRTCVKTAAVSCSTSHADAVNTPLWWIFKNALWKASHSCRITCERSESAWERKIALYKSNHHHLHHLNTIVLTPLWMVWQATKVVTAQSHNLLSNREFLSSQCLHLVHTNTLPYPSPGVAWIPL